MKKRLTPGKALYFSHGFGITYNDQTGIVPPKDVDVIMVAPKGSGTTPDGSSCKEKESIPVMPCIKTPPEKPATKHWQWASVSDRAIC